MDPLIRKIRTKFKENAKKEVRESGLRFFKEEVKLYGVKSVVVGQISKEAFKEIKDKNKSEIFTVCEKLWQSGFLEEAMVACHFSYGARKNFASGDIALFEKWIQKYVSNWATCDTFCNHTVGELLEMYPAKVAILKKWARSKNHWLRRAAAVSLIVPARHGKFLPEIFAIADILFLDEEDLVQKGYGWMLKVAGEKHQKEVFSYVMKNKKNMPRTALRYAIEKMPKNLKARAMAK